MNFLLCVDQMSEFATYFPVSADNFQRCQRLDSVQKQAFLDFLEGLDVALERDLYEKRVREYFRGHKLLGDAISLFADEVLGRAHPWTELKKQLLCHSGDGGPVDRSDVEAGQRQARTQKLFDVAELQLESLRDRSLGPVVWLFRGQDPANPFMGLNLATLPCRLGLDNEEADAHLFLEVMVPSGVTVRYATAFDGALNEKWRPGGMTKANDGCVLLGGLPEAVAPGAAAPGLGLTYGDTRISRVVRGV